MLDGWTERERLYLITPKHPKTMDQRPRDLPGETYTSPCPEELELSITHPGEHVYGKRISPNHDQ